MCKILDNVIEEALSSRIRRKKNGENDDELFGEAKRALSTSIIDEIEKNLVDKCMAKAKVEAEKLAKKDMAKKQVKEANNLAKIGVLLAFAVGFSVNQLTELVNPLKQFCTGMTWIFFAVSIFLIGAILFYVLEKAVNEYMRVDQDDV